MTDGTHVDLGHALITMVEPTRDPDRLLEYNRWYEHDHAYSGVMAGPWAFAFRRFVATRDLKVLRYPKSSTVADPVELGTFIALYWLIAGRAEDHFAWSYPQTQWLGEQGRMNPDRTHVSTSLYDLVGTAARPGWPVPAEIALDHPYPGLAVVWLDRNDGADEADLDRWLTTEGLASMAADGSPVGQALAFAPRDFPDTEGTGDGVGWRRCCVLMLTEDPRAAWGRGLADLGERVERSGLATIGLAAPFVPTVPGTTTYLDHLW